MAKITINQFSENKINKREPSVKVKAKEITTSPETDPVNAGSVSVYDEGALIITEAKEINFIGQDVRAVRDEGSSRVDVYISSPAKYSNFNDDNSITNAVIPDCLVSQRYIALPTEEGSPYHTGGCDLSALQNCVTNPILTYETPEAFALTHPSNTRIKAYVIDHNEERTLLADIAIDETKTVVTESGITVFVLSHEMNNAMIRIVYDLDEILETGGLFGVRMEHVYNGIVMGYKEQLGIFYDLNPIPAAILSCDYDLIEPQTKFLSGVEYITSETGILCELNQCDGLFSNSYLNNLIELTSLNFFASPRYFVLSDVETDTYWNASIVHLSKEIAIPEGLFVDTATIVQARPIDSTETLSVNSPAYNYLIDTLDDASTDILEDFSEESKRLKSSDLTPFNSETVLQDGELQFYNSRLVYPNKDFAVYNFVDLQLPDYSDYTGARSFVRKLKHVDVSHSNGIMRLIDYNFTDEDLIYERIMIAISLDGIEWYTLCDDYAGGELISGSGCRINRDTYNLSDGRIQFTLCSGKHTTEETDWSVFIRITYNDLQVSKGFYLGLITLEDWI